MNRFDLESKIFSFVCRRWNEATTATTMTSSSGRNIRKKIQSTLTSEFPHDSNKVVDRDEKKKRQRKRKTLTPHILSSSSVKSFERMKKFDWKMNEPKCVPSTDFNSIDFLVRFSFRFMTSDETTSSSRSLRACVCGCSHPLAGSNL